MVIHCRETSLIVKNILDNIVFGNVDENNIGQFSEGLLRSIPEVKNKVILDIGSGNGVLSIDAIKMGARFSFLNDIEPSFIKNSKQNGLLNNTEDKMEFIESCCSRISNEIFEVVDIVLFNPPQLPSDLISPEYKRKETVTFKSGGSDGFDIIRIVLSKLKDSISNEAEVYMTLSPLLNENELINIAKENGFNISLHGSQYLKLDPETVRKMKNKKARELISPHMKPKVRIFKLTKILY